ERGQKGLVPGLLAAPDQSRDRGRQVDRGSFSGVVTTTDVTVGVDPVGTVLAEDDRVLRRVVHHDTPSSGFESGPLPGGADERGVRGLVHGCARSRGQVPSRLADSTARGRRVRGYGS